MANKKEVMLENKKKIAQKKDKKLANTKEIGDRLMEQQSANLLTRMNEKIKDISKEIENINVDNENLTAPQIELILSSRSLMDLATLPYTREFTSHELIIGLEFYRIAIAEVNKKVKYTPNKYSFCNFMGMSTQTYNAYKVNPEKSEAMQIIDDYIVGVMFSEAQNNKIKEISTIFGLKSMHGLYEQQAPTIIEHKKSVDIDEIQQQLNVLKSQKKVIEVDVYEEK